MVKIWCGIFFLMMMSGCWYPPIIQKDHDKIEAQHHVRVEVPDHTQQDVSS